MIFKELSDSIKLSMIERTASPLVGFFLTAWLTSNWKLVLTLMWGDGAMDKRVAYVSEHYINVADNFWLPVGFTVAALIAYPILTYLPFKFWRYMNRRKEEIVEDYDSQKRPPAEAFNKLMREKQELAGSLHELLVEYEEKLDKALKEKESAASEQGEAERLSEQRLVALQQLEERYKALNSQLKLASKEMESSVSKQVEFERLSEQRHLQIVKLEGKCEQYVTNQAFLTKEIEGLREQVIILQTEANRSSKEYHSSMVKIANLEGALKNEQDSRASAVDTLQQLKADYDALKAKNNLPQLGGGLLSSNNPSNLPQLGDGLLSSNNPNNEHKFGDWSLASAALGGAIESENSKK